MLAQTFGMGGEPFGSIPRDQDAFARRDWVVWGEEETARLPKPKGWSERKPKGVYKEPRG